MHVYMHACVCAARETLCLKTRVAVEAATEAEFLKASAASKARTRARAHVQTRVHLGRGIVYVLDMDGAACPGCTHMHACIGGEASMTTAEPMC